MTRSEFYANWPYNTTDHLIYHYRLSCGFAEKNNGMGNDGAGKTRNLWDWLAISSTHCNIFDHEWPYSGQLSTINQWRSSERSKQCTLQQGFIKKESWCFHCLIEMSLHSCLINQWQNNFFFKNWRINTKKSKIILDLVILHRSGFNRTEEFWSTWTW